jgi:two-component system response regulator DevR
MTKTTCTPIRVMVVDDHEVVRLGLRTAFHRDDKIAVVGEADNVKSAVTESMRLRPDVILMDLRLPDGNGVEACREILSTVPGTRVLFLTSYSDEEAIVGAVFSGAVGYLLKDIGREPLLQAVHQVASGRSVLDPSLASEIRSHIHSLAHPPVGEKQSSLLSGQEQRVLALVAKGCTNKEIGQELGLSPKTVTNYLYRLYKKLQIKRRSQAATFFLQHPQ